MINNTSESKKFPKKLIFNKILLFLLVLLFIHISQKSVKIPDEYKDNKMLYIDMFNVFETIEDNLMKNNNLIDENQIQEVLSKSIKRNKLEKNDEIVIQKFKEIEKSIIDYVIINNDIINNKKVKESDLENLSNNLKELLKLPDDKDIYFVKRGSEK